MTSFCIATPKTAEQLFVRMTEVEKSIVRGSSNDDRLEYLRQTAFTSDGIIESEMKKLKRLVDESFAKFSAKMDFGCTWHF